MNFRNASLNEICTIHYGKDHKRLDEGAFPVYGSGGIIRHVNRFLYDKPSVLIPRKGTLSNLFFVDKPFWTVDTIFWTTIDEKKINPKFLYYSLLTKHLDELNIGSAVPSLSTEVLNKIVISVPPIPIQDKIVSELSSFDCRIESNNKINDNLSKQAFYSARFISPLSNRGSNESLRLASLWFSSSFSPIFSNRGVSTALTSFAFT